MGNEDKAALFDKLLFERDRYTERGEAGELFGNATNLCAEMEAYVTVSMAPRCARIKLKLLELFLAELLRDKPRSLVCCLIFFIYLQD